MTQREVNVLSGPPCAGDTLVEASVKILNTRDPNEKAKYTHETVRLWETGGITQTYNESGPNPTPPDRPARDDEKVKVLPAHLMPKRGKAGTLPSRQALIHSLVHIENWAVDLSWDIIARFGASSQMPRAFFEDFLQVAADEAKHFCLLEKRLEEMGSHYGALPAHDGLWESAQETAHSLPARLAIEHCTHEARGLDVLPQTVQRFRNAGDKDSANLLWDIIYEEEITHCAAGVRWFTYLHQRGDTERDVTSSSKTGGQEEAAGTWPCSVHEAFHAVLRQHFKGNLKPPFNEEARAKAGFGPEWYMPMIDVHGPAKH